MVSDYSNKKKTGSENWTELMIMSTAIPIP
jgi:hypothetical protein